MTHYIVKENFSTIRYIEADSSEAAIEEAKKGGLLDFDEIDHSRPTEMTAEVDEMAELLAATTLHDEIYSPPSFKRSVQRFRDTAIAQMRSQLLSVAANAIVKVATDFAPDAATFDDAISEDGPRGVHALIDVEDNIAKIFEENPELVATMRSSVEWDEQVRSTDASRAAHALVNEAIAMAEEIWSAEHVNTPSP